MADQKNTVNTVFTGEANLSAAEAELREFGKVFENVMARMAKATDLVDTRAMATVRNFNKAMGTMQQAQRTLQTLGVQPDRGGARSRSDIKGEAATMEGDLLAYRKTVSRALAGTVLEINDQIKRLNEAFTRLSQNRRKNAAELAKTQAEIDRLTRSRNTISNNPYVSAEIAGARTTRAKQQLRTAAADDRMAAKGAEELSKAKLRLIAIENELATLNARQGGRAPARISQLRQEQQQLRELAASYEAVTAVMQKYDQNYTRNLGKTLAGNDKAAIQSARQYLQVEERVAVIKRQINEYEAGQLRLNQADLANLRTELKMSEQLLNLHRQDAALMARANGMRKAPADTRSRFERTSQEMRDNPQGLMGIQTEVMANYAALSAAQQGAYAIADFAVKRETAMAQFRAIASASGAETARLSEDMERLGQNSKYTNLEIAETATLLAQAGLSARDTGGALKAISELATAAGVELRQAADVVTSISNIWGYNVSQMDDIANVLTAALNKTKLGMDQIQLGVQYAGNVAADAGVDFVELTSIMGAMANAGIRSGSTIGTGLRALVTDLQNPTEKTVATMERLGLTMSDVDIRTLGLTQVLHNLKAAGFTSADAMGAFEIRAAAAFSAISNNLNIVDQLQGSLYDTDAAARANAIQMDTLSAKWTSFTNAALTLGADALAPVIGFLKEFLEFGTEVIGLLDVMMPAVQGVTVALVAMFATFAIGRLTMAIGALGSMVASLRLVKAETLGVAAANTTLMRSIPFVGWVGIIAGVATALVSLANGTLETKDTLDNLEGAINDLTSQMMESENSIKSVDTAVAQLTQRSTALAENQNAQQQVLEATRRRFEALGLKVDDSTNSVDGMIAALGRLRNELAKEFQSQLLTLADRLQEKVDYINKGLEEGSDVVTGDRRKEALDAAVRQGGLIGQRGAFGPEGALIQDVLNGRTKMDSQQDKRAFVEARNRVRNQLRPLQGQINAAAPGSNERRRLETRQTDLRAFLSVANDVVDKLGQIATLETERLTAEQDAAYQGLMADPNSMASKIRAAVTTDMAKFGPQAAAIYSSNDSPATKSAAAERLKDQAELRLGELEDQARRIAQRDPSLAAFADRFMEELMSSSRRQMNTSFAQNDALRSRAQADNRVNGREVQQDRDDTQDLERREATAKKRLLEARLGELEAQIEAATNVQELATAREEWLRLNGQLTAALAAERNAQLATSGMADRRGGLAAPVSASPGSRFGLRVSPTAGASTNHRGVDYPVAVGTAVMSAGVGRVVYADKKDGYGNTVEVEHANGLRTLYAHLSEILVAVDDTVDRGQQIAKSGGARGAPGSGTSTGAHLHFGVYRNGQAVDPLKQLGAGGPGAGADPTLDRIRAMEEQEFNAEQAKRLADMEKDFLDKQRELEFIPLSRALKARRDTNNLELKNLIDTLETAGDDTTQLADVVASVRQRVTDNIDIAQRLLTADPKNAARLNTEEFKAEVEQEAMQEILKGAERLGDAYTKFIALRERLGEGNSLETQQQIRIAGATAGTSATTSWLLAQRLEAEEYQTALDVLTASQQVYTQALLEQSRAEGELATQRRIGTAEDIRLAETKLNLARQMVAQAGVGVTNAQRAANSAQPVGPISSQAAGATAAGIDPLKSPSALLMASIDRFKAQSGVMTGVAQTVADGIYGSFEALAAGIENTINQIADGSITIRGAFANIFGGILKEMQGMAAKIAANWIMQYILKMVMAQFGAPVVGGGMDAQGMSMLNSGPMPGVPLALGGTPRRRALGGNSGSPMPGRDSIHALVAPGEITMRESAVNFIGRDNLLALNAMGNRRISAAGARMPEMAKREPDNVNVWLAAPSQIPPPSEKDIIHTIGESMVHGELKKLVRTVAVGG